jgi:glucose/arabinose dehydrogenase
VLNRTARRAIAARWGFVFALLFGYLDTSFLAPPARSNVTKRPEIVAEHVIGGLRQAVAFAFDPSGRIWFVEKALGLVRIFDPTTGAIHRFFRVPDVVAEAEQGLVGIALRPTFPDPPLVYLYATRKVDGAPHDEVIVVVAHRDRGRHMRVLWDAPADPGHQHSGGRIVFGPDGMLYVAVGDAGNPSLAQNPDSDRGKILRLTPGRRSAHGGLHWVSAPFASCIRNSFGLAFDPIGGDLWESENGPECNDELNMVEPGVNYGWGPSAECLSPNDDASTSRDGPHPIQPLLAMTPTIAPTGLAFCERCGLGAASEGALFFGDYNEGNIHRAILDRRREEVVSERVVAAAPDLALSFEVGQDGAIYFSSYLAIFRLELRGGSLSTSPRATTATSSPPGSRRRVSAEVTTRAELGWVAAAVIAALGSLLVLAMALRRHRGRRLRRRPIDSAR